MGDNFSIGAGLELSGEKQFTDAIKSINKDLTVLGSEMKKVTAQFDGNADSMEALTAKQKVYNDRAEEQRKKIEVMTAALENAKTEFGENSDKVKDWQIKLNNAEADLSKTENALKQTTDQLDNFGKETDQAADKQEKFGNQTEETTKKVNAFAAKALAAMAAAAAAAGAALLKLAVDAGEFADELITTSNQTGISTEQLQEWDYAMRFIDVDMNTVTGSMAKLIKNMDNASKGTKDQVEAFSELGVAFTDGNGDMRDSQTVFMEVIDALGKMENETERDALSMRLFGKSAQDLNPLIKAGSDELARLSEEAHNVGAVVGGDALAALGEFDDNMQMLKGSIQGLKNQALAELTPYINDMISVLQTNMPAIIEGIKGFVSFVIDNGDTIISVIAGIAAGLLAWNVIAMVQGLITAIKGWQIATEGMTIAQKLLNIVMAANPIGIVITLVSALVAAIIVLWNTNEDFKNKVIEIWTSIKSFFKSTIDAIAGFFTETIPATIEKVVGWFKELPQKVSSAVMSKIEDIKSIGKNIVKGVWDGIFSKVKWFTDEVKNFFSGIVNGVKSVLGIASPSKVFAGIGNNMALGLGEGFTDAMRGVAKKINNSIPTGFNVGMNVNGYGGAGVGIGGTAVSNIYMDSVLIASASSRVQYRKNATRARSYGVVPV